MKLHLPIVLLSAVLTACCAFSAQAIDIPDTYEQVDIWDSGYLSDYASNASTDYIAFLLGQDIVVSSDITMDGGNLLFTSSDGLPSVSLEFTGGDAPALSNQSSLVFDTLSGLSFTSYMNSAIITSGNMVIQNVTDGVEDSDNPDVLFTGNSAASYYDSYGGAIYAYWGVSISGNGDVTFTGNTATSSYDCCEGGAIYTLGTVSINGNGDVAFTGNTATASSSSKAYGGAIFAGGYVSITGNGDVTFTGNTATAFSSYGGAIYARSGVSITGNKDVTFTGNTATASSSSYDDIYSYGGAIYAFDGGVSITGNGDVLFTGNSASSSASFSDSYGGAIYAEYGGVSISGNGDVTFTGNSASSYYCCEGGAIYTVGTVSINGNGDVAFTGNTATASSSSSDFAYSCGGAIFAGGVSITGNGDVTFTGNTATAFSSYGGAIYAFDGGVSITGNGDVLFTGNSASFSFSYGGAIYARSGGVSISGNETVCFEKNYERANSTYRLRSIYTTGDLNLSAKTGGHITFHDSVYGGTTALNADYTDADGVTQQATGTIIFSGQYTKDHLDAILEANNEGRVATAEEILNSRTSTLGATTLYGGTLHVLDGAILETASLSVEAGSSASVLLRDAELKGTAGITFNAGTTLQVQGDSLITGDVLLLAGCALDIDGGITINGTLSLGQGLTLSGDILVNIQNLEIGQSLTLVSGLESLAVQTQELMRSVEYTTVLSGQDLVASDYFSNLQGAGNLVLVYDESAGSVSITCIPEPTTATLSLLALAGLCARRRRK